VFTEAVAKKLNRSTNQNVRLGKQQRQC